MDRHNRPAPAGESLEGRMLLSGARAVRFGGVAYAIRLEGPGTVSTLARPGQGAEITLRGTTAESRLAVARKGALQGEDGPTLPISRLNVRSGALGAISAFDGARLNGQVAPLRGPVDAVAFDAIGPDAVLDIGGDLGSLSVAEGVKLGTKGRIRVAGDLRGSFNVGEDLDLEGGQVAVDHDLTGTLDVGGDLTASRGGSIRVGRDLTSLRVRGSVRLTEGATLGVARTLGTVAVDHDVDTNGGTLVVGDVGRQSIRGATRGRGIVETG
jgi:hypothetical protein